MKKVFTIFTRELPTKDIPQTERPLRMEIAFRNLENRLADIFKSNPIAREKAESSQGLYWQGLGGCYLVSLLIRYDRGSVLMLSSHTEIGLPKTI